MSLQQDERALLQLICERGQSYSDIAELLGIGEVEVRAKARNALVKLGGADPDEVVGLTDFLLGQADPIGRADAVRYLQQDADGRELAATITSKLAMLAPEAELPALPEPKGRRSSPRRATTPARSEASPPPPSSPSHPGADPAPLPASTPGRQRRASGSRTPEQTRMLAGLAGAAVVLLFVILAVAGVFSGSDDGTSGEAAAAEEQRDVTSVPLEAQGGSGVAGTANFALANTTLFVDLQVEGLDPEPGRGRAYLMWLMITPDAGFPLPTPLTPNANGVFRDRIPIANELLGVATAAQTVRISETSTRSLGEAVNVAAEEGSPVLAFDGKNLAAGEIPIADVTGGTGEGGSGSGGGNGQGGGSGSGQSGGSGSGEGG